MIDQLNTFFTDNMKDLTRVLPDGITAVDLPLLSKMNIIDDASVHCQQGPLPQHMYAVETEDRITLYNDSYVAWIVPQKKEPDSETLLLIALLANQQPKVELGFSFRGIHNQAKTILKVLDTAIFDIRQTEQELHHIMDQSNN